MGSTWEYPPPAAPPLMPNTGPKEGSRSVDDRLLPIFAWPGRVPRWWWFASPAGVGLMAVTKSTCPPFHFPDVQKSVR